MEDFEWNITESRLRHLEQCERDLSFANNLIARLRAENQVLKDEKKRFVSTIENCKKHISICGNAHKKYGVAFVKSQIIKSRLL